MSTKRVSVIIACYQHGRFLAGAVESALAQTWENLEIIIIDDGSTDETPKVARELAGRHGERVRVVRQENRGQARARQAGLERATGDYSVLLDADDLLEPVMAEIGARRLSEDLRFDAIVGRTRLVDADGGATLGETSIPRVPDWPSILRNNPYPYPCAVVARAARVRQVGGLEAGVDPGAEDWDLWARMTRAGMRFLAVDETFAEHRVSPEGHSRGALRALRATIQMLDFAVAKDPRLARDDLSPYGPISRREYGVLRNGKVFRALGLALGGGAGESEVREALGLLTGGAAELRFWRDQLLEGLHDALGARGAAGMPPFSETTRADDVADWVDDAMRTAGLDRSRAKMLAHLRESLADPLRKRSLRTRVAERLGG